MYRCINSDCGDVYWDGDDHCFVCGRRGIVAWTPSFPSSQRFSQKTRIVRFIVGDIVVTEEVEDLFGER